MLTESFFAAVEAVNKPSAHLSSAFKDVGIFQYEFQPQNIFRHGFKKTSVKPNCLAISNSHVFAAQAGKAVIHVYNREKGNQEATVPFPDKIHSLAYAQDAAVLIIGTEDGKLVLWQVGSGRISTSTASHLEAVSCITVNQNNDQIISGSSDSNIHIWSLDRLICFDTSSQSINDEASKDAPLRSFSSHRAGISALAVGHSRSNTNFAVSTSSDRTCLLWHIETCQVLRTFLTPSICLSIILDPADRAIYLGNDNGTIQSIDLFAPTSKSKQSIYDTIDAVPIQLRIEDEWSSSAADVGAVNCLTLSYDATTLLSGHTGGSIMRWDISKHRIVTEVANLHQPVSTIQMLIPDGLRHNPPHYIIPTIIKPRLELNAESTESTIGIPASYALQAQVIRVPDSFKPHNEISSVLAGALFPDSWLDEAILAMTTRSGGAADSAASGTDKQQGYKIQTLEEDKMVLEKQLAAVTKLYNDSQQRHRKRSERREKIGLQRREAYFAAKKKGRDGDAAMKPFDKQLEDIDVESDEEELASEDQMEVDAS